jgi:hypothetical protein|tara:strand:- start:8934 stop:10145 length:1212 start_codon:yes stop_codon:yes gene_type:complete
MTPLEKFNLMIQGGYNPMGGGINTNQMNDFIAAGFRKPFDNKPVMQNLFNTQQFSQNVEDKKQADQRLKNQQLGNFLLAFSDTLRGVNPAQGVLQRQEIFQQQADERKAEANQQNLITNAVAIAKEAGATPEQIELIKGNPQLAMSVAQSSFDQKTNKLPTSVEEFQFAQENPEFAEFLKSKKGPLVNIDSSTKQFEQESAKLAIDTVKEERKNVAAGRDIDDRLLVLEKSIDNVDTGALEELKLPFKKLGAALNILPADELEQLNQQELFQSFTGYIIPRMRVVGSGATSDREIELFKSAVPTIGNTKEGNKLLIGGLRAITKYNKERLRLMENYVNKKKTIFGFEEFADAELGSLYKSFNSPDEYENLVKNQKIKEGDFVYNGVTGQFIIIDKEDIKAAYE